MGQAERFEAFLTNLFSKEGLKVVVPSAPIDLGCDLLLVAPNQQRVVVEWKLVKSRQMSARSLMTSVNKLEHARNVVGAVRGVLAVPSQIDRTSIEAISISLPHIVVYDLVRLRFLASRYRELAIELEDIVQRSVYMAEDLQSLPHETINVSDLFDNTTLPLPEWNEDDYAAMPKGAELCQRMYATPEGREGAKAFEVAATNALKYLFSDQLTGWTTQHGTEGRMSYFDLVNRISGGHDFWRMLIDSFRSRYVIFEFKNYADPIGQSEIYTTEKYLFATALRNTAIIVARNGANDNALRAAAGALKEHGKLILIISAADICEMLNIIDVGNEPSDFLLTLLDDFLTRLER